MTEEMKRGSMMRDIGLHKVHKSNNLRKMEIKIKEIECPKCNNLGNEFWIKEDGYCLCCKFEKEKIQDRERDKKTALEDGSITRDNEIMCPYCGYVEEDSCDYHNSSLFHCYECEKESELSIDYTPHFTTTVIKKYEDSQN